MTARVIDFDAFLRERNALQGDTSEAPRVTVGGREYILPSDLPAIIAVEVMRGMREKGADGEVPAEALEQIGSALFKDEWRPLLMRTGMSMRDMGDLIIQVFRLYDPAAGGETVPNRKARRQAAKTRSTSSRTGR